MRLLLPNRSPLAPEIPAIVEAGFPKFSVSPRAELNALIRRQDVRDSLLKQAFDPKGSTVDEFTPYVRAQYEIWGRAIREAGIQPE